MGIGVNLDVLTNEISGQLSEQGKKDLLRMRKSVPKIKVI